MFLLKPLRRPITASAIAVLFASFLSRSVFLVGGAHAVYVYDLVCLRAADLAELKSLGFLVFSAVPVLFVVLVLPLAPVLALPLVSLVCRVALEAVPPRKGQVAELGSAYKEKAQSTATVATNPGSTSS